MNWNDPRAVQVFFDVHSDLPREGPGDRTARALALAGPLPEAPRVLDIACGPGMQTMDLAELMPDALIAALDRHPPFLAELRRRTRARGVAGRVATVQGDMKALPFAPASFDLLWCEGAAYIMGVEAALRAWRPLLAPGGRLAFTEAVWLRPDPPEPVRRLWTQYAAMGDIASCRRLAERSGYRVLGDFVLPEEAWWEHYYAPMHERLTDLAPSYRGDAIAEGVLDECREEIAAYRAFSRYYGYVFLVLAAED